MLTRHTSRATYWKKSSCLCSNHHTLASLTPSNVSWVLSLLEISVFQGYGEYVKRSFGSDSWWGRMGQLLRECEFRSMVLNVCNDVVRKHWREMVHSNRSYIAKHLPYQWANHYPSHHCSANNLSSTIVIKPSIQNFRFLILRSFAYIHASVLDLIPHSKAIRSMHEKFHSLLCA